MPGADWLPVGQTIIAAEPGDGRDAGHPSGVETARIAAEVTATHLHNDQQLQQVKFAGKDAPRLEIQGGQEGRHLAFFAFIGRAGENDLFGGEATMELAQDFRDLRRRQFFVVLGRERTDVEPSSSAARFLQHAAARRFGNLRMDLGLVARKSCFFQTMPALGRDEFSFVRVFHDVGEHRVPKSRAAIFGAASESPACTAQSREDARTVCAVEVDDHIELGCTESADASEILIPFRSAGKARIAPNLVDPRRDLHDFGYVLGDHDVKFCLRVSPAQDPERGQEMDRITEKPEIQKHDPLRIASAGIKLRNRSDFRSHKIKN